MHDGLSDSLLRPALVAFAESERQALLTELVNSVRQEERSTLKESRIAGRIEVYEGLLDALDTFAREQLSLSAGTTANA